MPTQILKKNYFLLHLLFREANTSGEGEPRGPAIHLWKVERRANTVLIRIWDRARTEPDGPTLDSLQHKMLLVDGIGVYSIAEKRSTFSTWESERDWYCFAGHN